MATTSLKSFVDGVMKQKRMSASSFFFSFSIHLRHHLLFSFKISLTFSSFIIRPSSAAVIAVVDD
jgi:hypothetical protein